VIRLRVASGVVAVAAAWWAAAAWAADVAAIVERNEPAALVLWGSDPDTGRVLQGSGCCVDTSGYVLTVAHQVAGLGAFRARLRDGSTCRLTLIEMDKPREVALLKADRPLPRAVRIGDARPLRSGDPLVAITAPVGLEFSAVTGIVSNPNRTRQGHPMIQTDLPASPGSSGGPVFDADGMLIGLIVNRLEREQWIKLLTPINNAYDMLRRNGVALPDSRAVDGEIIPAPGLSEIERQAIKAYNRGVLTDSAAAKADAYTQAVRLLPDFFEAWFNLAVASVASGDTDRAITAYRRAEGLEGGGSRAVAVQRNLGRVYLAEGRGPDAAACFERAVTLAPNDAASHNDLGEAYRSLDRLAEAEQCLRRALEINPSYAAARFNLGLTLGAVGKRKAASDQFRQYLRLEPEAADAGQVRQWIEELSAAGS